MLNILRNLTGESIKIDRLVQENAFHRAILESSTDFAIITADLEGIVSSWNIGAYNVLGWTEAEMLGQPAARFFTPEDTAQGQPEREMNSCLVNGRAEDERWHLRKDHTRFWANGLMMPLRTPEGQHIGYLKILRDRTDQRKIQDALQESETRNRLALAAGNIGIWETDLDLGHVIWDDRTRELFGVQKEEALNYELSFLQRIDASDRERVHLRISEVAAGFGEEVFDEEFKTLPGVKGKERWVHARGRVIERRDYRCLMGTVRDVTRQKETELLQELLTGELEHRIKNTLAMVQSIVSQSLRNAESPKAATAAITERLISLSKAHDLLTRNNWSSSVIGDVVTIATQFHGAVDRVHIAGPNLKIGAKPALNLALVLHELCTNAVKYGALSNDTGRVDISWSLMGDDEETTFDFCWQEFDGPPVGPVTQKGFGSRLIENSMGSSGATSSVLTFDITGVKWCLRTPLAYMKASD